MGNYCRNSYNIHVLNHVLGHHGALLTCIQAFYVTILGPSVHGQGIPSMTGPPMAIILARGSLGDQFWEIISCITYMPYEWTGYP